MKRAIDIDMRFLFYCMLSLAGAFALAANLYGATASRNAPDTPAPASPREFFNAGTLKLHEGKLREAEAFFESALASQNERLQPPAMYNLGHVRFKQGVEELKKGPEAGATAQHGRSVGQGGDEAIHSADEALAGNDLEQMVAAYLRGKGSRREMKAAMAAVKKAMEAQKATLSKWQRASGDFRGTVELKRKDEDAQHNADVVDQCIAKLVDSLRELQQMANALGDKKQELGEKLKQLKGKIPAPNMPPGAAGDDEEDEDQPKGPEPGQKEGPSKEGQEMELSKEQAGWLLDSFKLDSERRLPMGQGPEATPKDRNRPDW